MSGIGQHDWWSRRWLSNAIHNNLGDANNLERMAWGSLPPWQRRTKLPKVKQTTLESKQPPGTK